MNSKSVAATALCMGLMAVTAGCGSTDDGYVDFEKTAPLTPDHGSETAGAETPAADTSVTDDPGTDGARSEVRPASGADGPDTSGVNHAVSRTRSTSASADDAEQPDPEITSAGATTSDSASSDATGIESSARSPVPAVASETATLPSEDSSTPASALAAAGQIVSAQSGLIGPADNPLIENATSSEPSKIELLIPEKVFRKERGSNAVRVSYDDLDLLKILNMEPVPANAADYFPDWLKALDGKSIRIRGFMYPTFEATGLTAFTLARDNGICCFVRKPKIYDIISIRLASGVTSDYIEGRPFDVEGILHIEPLPDEDNLSRLYRIDEARVLR